MMILVDTPIMSSRPHRRHRAVKYAVAATALFLAALSWGEGPIVHFGNMNGLDVQVEFMGFQRMAPTAGLVYQLGHIMGYRITATNRSNTSLNQLEMQSLIQSDEGRRISGPSLSPVHQYSLAPGQSYLFEVEYDIPSVLEVSKGFLQFKVHYIERGTFKSDNFLCHTLPLLFE